MIYGIVAIIGALFFAYRLIANLIVEHRTAALRAQDAQEQQTFNQDIQKSEEEIRNAKLSYQNARRKLDDDSGPNAS